MNGGNPDLSPRTLCRSLNTSFYRAYADKKLYVRFPARSILLNEFQADSGSYPFYHMEIALAKGPYGIDPFVSGKEFDEYTPLIQRRQMVVGWTTKYPEEDGSAMGYTKKDVRAMFSALKKVRSYSFPFIEFEAVHASHSVDILEDLFNATKFVLISTLDQTEKTARMINLPELNRMVNICGKNRVFLNVPDSVRYYIVPPPPLVTKNPYRKYYSWNGACFSQVAGTTVVAHFILLLFFARLSRNIPSLSHS